MVGINLQLAKLPLAIRNLLVENGLIVGLYLKNQLTFSIYLLIYPLMPLRVVRLYKHLRLFNL